MSNRRIYRQVAKKFGATAAEVKRDMQTAIDDAYINPPNDGVRKAYQNSVPCKDTIPTVDEILAFAKNELKKSPL